MITNHAHTGSDPGWKPITQPVKHVALTMSVPCDHCAKPIPINGPTQRLHCDHCQRETTLTRMAEELSLAAEQMQSMGSPYRSTLYSSADPLCAQCGEQVPIDEYVGYSGGVTALYCPSCGSQMPTYPAPSWLRDQLPGALQVFGGDPELAREHAGLSLHVNQKRVDPVMMACPGCAGSLSVGEHSARTLACSYCHGQVFIPDELWRRLHPVKTMKRWTLTYVGSLKTEEELREEEEERREEEAERAERVVYEEKSARSTRRSKWIGWGGTIIGIAVAVGVAGFSFLGKGCSKVEGSFVSSGEPLGEMTFKPTKCKSLQRMGAFGVVLLSGDSNEGIKLVQDPTRGMLVQVKIPSTCNGSTCKAVTFDREECTRFDVDVSRTNTTVNGVRLLDGRLGLECKFAKAGGTAKADIRFKRCD